MSRALAVYHGQFGRATLYDLDRPMTTHAHREGHLAFLLRGAPAGLHVSGHFHRLDARTAVAVNPWEPHDFAPGEVGQGALFLVLYVKPLWFLEVARSAEAALRFGTNRIEIDDRIGRGIGRVVTLLTEASGLEPFDGYLYELTQACFDQSWQWTPPCPARASFSPRLTDFRVRRSIKLMNEQIGSDVALDEVARQSGLSRPHFYKLFREQTGLTPNLYFNTLRMERALEFLTQSERSVTDIGFELGFASQSSFTRFFAANVGMAPSDYRRVAYHLAA